MSDLDEVRRAGLIRKRLRGGYALTQRGYRYLRDAILRHDGLRAEMSRHIEKWEAGEMTKDEKREALVELVLHAWDKDAASEAEALADLRSQGFDPVEALRRDTNAPPE